MSDPQDAVVRPAKAPPPELATRAPRPRPVRVRRGAAIAIGAGAGILFGGALAWAFVVSPQLRGRAAARPAAEAKAEGAARPSEIITRQPATYAAATLPPPRRFGAEPAEETIAPTKAADRAPSAPSLPRSRPEPGPAMTARARASELLFATDRSVSPGTPASVSLPADLGRVGPIGGADAAPQSRLVAPVSPFEVKAGAIIPAAMLTALDTSRPGAMVAVTTEPVYDTVTGRILLIPPGSRLLGRQDGASKYGDRRAFLTWERLILPNGRSLALASEPGVDAQGAHGVAGRADRRVVPLLQASLFAGAITTLGQAARDRSDESGGWLGDAGDAAAIQGAQIGGRLVGRELDVSPSIRLSAGSAVRVLLTRDLILEPFAP